MLRPLAAAALAFALTGLAGCLAPNDVEDVARPLCGPNATPCDAQPVQVGPATPGALDNATLSAVPVWEVGDHWQYKWSDGSTVTLVVVAVGSTYEVRPTDNRTALWEAVFDMSLVGGIGKDLSGDQAAGRVKYFDWPLEDGKTWTVSMEGRSGRATATQQGQDWRIVVADGNQTLISYTYSPAAKWMKEIRWSDGFGASLVRSGPGYQGPVLVADVQPRYVYSASASTTTTFNIGTGASAVAATFSYEGQQGYVGTLQLVDPKGRQFAPIGTPGQACTSPCGPESGMQLYPAVPGSWTASATSAGNGRLAATVYEVTDLVRQVS